MAHVTYGAFYRHRAARSGSFRCPNRPSLRSGRRAPESGDVSLHDEADAGSGEGQPVGAEQEARAPCGQQAAVRRRRPGERRRSRRRGATCRRRGTKPTRRVSTTSTHTRAPTTAAVWLRIIEPDADADQPVERRRRDGSEQHQPDVAAEDVDV